MLQQHNQPLHFHIPIPPINTTMDTHFSTFLNTFPTYDHDHFGQSSSLSNNSTSDDAEDQQQLSGVVDERKRRRMISNRESARRSRMRKQKHLDELWSQVVRLRTENHSLMDKLNHATECHQQVVDENAKLKEETCELRQMLADLQIGTPFKDLQDIGLGSECSDQSTDTDM